MKRFLNYFKIPFIVVAVIAVICFAITAINSNVQDTGTDRHDESGLTTNVFNYAGNLSDADVKILDEHIAQIEEQTQCDIAVVTLNETLEGYYNTQASEWVMCFADDFADNNNMGYDKAHGNSIVFVDNIYREPSTGRVYSWISTSGLAMSKLSQSECSSIMDKALEDLSDYSSESDYMDAYTRVVDLLPVYMKGGNIAVFASNCKPVYVIGAALLIAVIYVLVNWTTKAGSRTTSSTTYVANGRPNISVKRDVYLRKSVSKRKIESSSGGHTSSGGFSHGGGGHSR